MSWLGRVALAIVAGVLVVYALIVLFLGEAPAWTTTTKICEMPKDTPNDGFPYSVWVREPSLSLSLNEAAPEAWVGRSSGYGVAVELNASTDPDGVTCRWRGEAVEIEEPNGIVHRVPRSFYEGGR